MARLKLATYNINGIRARLGALLEWLERERPDIVCLQELKAPDEAFPLADIEAAGYGAIWQGQKSWNGVAILARGATPQERRRGLPGGAEDLQSRYLEASVHGLVVGCLYLPNGNPWPGPKFDYKLDWFGRLISHARALLHEGEPVVLAGDFNVVATDELDIYDPKSWRKDALLQPESRDAWFKLLEQGWTDSLRTVAGDAKVFTFWDYFRKHWERDAGLRIDHLLLSPELSALLADAGVDRWVRGRPGASDHAPTWVLLDAKGAAGKGGTARRPARTDSKAAAGVDGDKTPTARENVAVPSKSKRPAPRKSEQSGTKDSAAGRKPAGAHRKTAAKASPAVKRVKTADAQPHDRKTAARSARASAAMEAPATARRTVSKSATKKSGSRKSSGADS